MKRFFHFALVRMFAGILLLIGVTFLCQTGIREWLHNTAISQVYRNLIVGLTTTVVALFSYYGLYRWYEQRNITELSLKGQAKYLVTGIGLGALLQSLTIGVIVLMGGFTIEAINPVSVVLPAFVMGFTSAIFEEILVRGVVFRLLEEMLGSYPALFISAAVFGALHLGNPNSTWIAAVGIALQAGLFLAVAFMYTRNLWFPIAVHFAWNFTQAGIFGASVSGNVINSSLFATRIEGETWYTGGSFGPEGSIQATLFCLTAAAVLWRGVRKRKQVLLPPWKHAKL